MKHSLHSLNVQGFETEIFTQAFSDRLFILITQLGKPGTMVTASKVSTQISDEDIFDIKTVWGKRDSEFNDILSRLLVNEISKKLEKPILFSFAFDPKFEQLIQEKGVKEILSPIITSVCENGRVW